MRVDILTLFPEHMNAMLHESILGRAARKGLLEINCVQIRDYTANRQHQVDDYPYGGGWGCVMMAQPLKSCLEAVLARSSSTERRRVIYLSPQGKTFTQGKARELAENYDRLVLVCGHYEGVDERFIESCVDEELSLGDFVLTGGELAAMAVTDAVCRLVPGVLSDAACYTGESHWEGLLEYPQYTRPEVWEGRPVPQVLRSGNQAEIDRWRRKQMLARTMDKRPELFAALTLSPADEKLLAELKKDRSRFQLVAPVLYRPAAKEDIPAVLELWRQASASLRRFRVDQWQEGYPGEAELRADLSRGEAWVLTYEGETAAYFCLSAAPEPAYDALTDGKWRCAGPYRTLHRAAVGKKYRGSGLADRLMVAAEALSRKVGAAALRTDTHRKNLPMKRLLERCGYRYRGNLLISVPEHHDPRRQAFEKLLDEGEMKCGS